MTALTPYHAKLIAHDLLRRGPTNTAEKFTRTLADAQVDLNPHQVEAALFAFKSPLSNGALLADEVGLGKTIEAGILLAQHWAEGRRRLLVICPANLRKQWSRELEEKFYLPTCIYETKSWNAAIKVGLENPLDLSSEQAAVIICSYPFASKHARRLQLLHWDIVVMDEAHRLRNVLKKGNKTAIVLRDALDGQRKVMLTATPLQNSVAELYGLVSFIDPHAFGDEASFKQKFGGKLDAKALAELAERLKPFCHRTLRRDVQEYVKYTARLPLLQKFEPSEDEQLLYDKVSAFLSRPELQSLPNSQRQLIELILRKLLASSTFAIAGALNTIRQRLDKRLQADDKRLLELAEELGTDFELAEETAEELQQTQELETELNALSDADRQAIRGEISELEEFHALAVSIGENAKGLKLLEALRIAFAQLEQNGAAAKALIFTESRRTQDYVMRLLREHTPWGGEIVLFNGTNTDPESRVIYNAWKKRWEGSDRITGSPTADMRAALVEHFKSSARIMIATEAAAEGLNLQFCSLIINYDLPWNPQRIEQRIGRCHRYGQKHDVVVVNFLNTKNKADERVFELLDSKFQLFSGVFGASDEVLGAIENGVEFESRILSIYRRCRTTDAIEAEFDALQREMEATIADTKQDTHQKLLAHFSAEVIERLKITKEATEVSRTETEEKLWDLTRYGLAEHAEFLSDTEFQLAALPCGSLPNIPLGKYSVGREAGEGHRYRIGHPLAQSLLQSQSQQSTPPICLNFQQPADQARAAALNALRGSSGELEVWLLTLDAGGQNQDFLVHAGIDHLGNALTSEQIRRLFELPAPASPAPLPSAVNFKLDACVQREKQRFVDEIRQLNSEAFESEMTKLDRWADDRKGALESEIRELDRQIREMKRMSKLSTKLEEKIDLQRQAAKLERTRADKRSELYAAEDEIDSEKEGLLAKASARLQPKEAMQCLFRIAWTLAE